MAGEAWFSDDPLCCAGADIGSMLSRRSRHSALSAVCPDRGWSSGSHWGIPGSPEPGEAEQASPEAAQDLGPLTGVHSDVAFCGLTSSNMRHSVYMRAGLLQCICL